jgi:excisionase family DNA binding protein
MGYKPSQCTPIMVSAGDAAAMMSVSIAQIWVWVKTGVLPHVRQGRLMRIRVADINTLIEQGLSTEWQAHPYNRQTTRDFPVQV